MIKVNLDENERLSYMIARISSKADETLNALRRTSFEMQSDEELLSFPQGALSAELVLYAIQNLNRLNETLQSLTNTVRSANEEYGVLERELTSSVSRLTGKAATLSVSFASAVSSEKAPVIDYSYDMYRQNELQKVLGKETVSLQTVNLAPICEILKKEYGDCTLQEISEDKRGAVK